MLTGTRKIVYYSHGIYPR